MSETFVSFPETVFMLGGSYDWLPAHLREADRVRHLGLRSILDSTPPVWVHLGSFGLAAHMVTNGEYLAFLEDAREGAPEAHCYDEPRTWSQVWRDYPVTKTRVTSQPAPGNLTTEVEDYTHVQGFVEAYLESLRYETRRVAPPSDTASAAAARAFAIARWLLRDSIVGDADAGDEDLLSGLTSISEIVKAIDLFAKELATGYRQRVPQGQLTALKAGQFPEALQFFTRLSGALRQQGGIKEPIPLRRVFFPRGWIAWDGDDGHTGFQSVPWTDQPVTGITLHEALAFAYWLRQRRGLRVTLPTEAQFERAASWPAEPLPAPPEAVFDPSLKLPLPWADRNTDDYHRYFGRVGTELAGLLRNRKDYDDVLRRTCRELAGGERIYQLEGFGWQWTLDRFDPAERRYSRFRDREFRVFNRLVCREVGRRAPLTVFEYEPNANVGDSHFVLKGSPDLVGGGGLTMRRYAANPLRGHPRIGIRLAVQGDE